MLAETIQAFRQGKNHMEIPAIQHIVLPCLYPSVSIGTLTFRTMAVAATVVAYSFRTAIRTTLHMSAQSRCTAHFDSPKHFLVIWQYGTFRYKTASGLTDNFRQFIPCPHGLESVQAI